MSVDMRVDSDFQPVAAASGDAAMISGDDCFLQTLKVEAASAENDLWYDLDWGWSLLDFAQAQQTELTQMEIEQRVRQKLEAHEEISVNSISVSASWEDDQIAVAVAFRLLSSEELYQLSVNIGRTEIEVVSNA